MVESSKILTVSYGTFSCTLEGFDDSFATMKAIAEYFRDLAAGDRYFGAEPPTPDAEMLTRIAEREIAGRVSATSDENGIVLRAAAALAPAAEPVAADPAPQHDVSVAADTPVVEAEGADLIEPEVADVVEAEAEAAPVDDTAGQTIAGTVAEPVSDTVSDTVAETVDEIVDETPATDIPAEAAQPMPPVIERPADAPGAADLAAAETAVNAFDTAHDAVESPLPTVLAATKTDAQTPDAPEEETPPLLAVSDPAAQAEAEIEATLPASVKGPADITFVPTTSFDEMEPATLDTPDVPDVPAHPDADSVAAKLQRIRAVVGKSPELAEDGLVDDGYAEDLPSAEAAPSDSIAAVMAAVDADASVDTYDDDMLGRSDDAALSGLPEDEAGFEEIVPDDMSETDFEVEPMIAEASDIAEESVSDADDTQITGASTIADGAQVTDDNTVADVLAQAMADETAAAATDVPGADAVDEVASAATPEPDVAPTPKKPSLRARILRVGRPKPVVEETSSVEATQAVASDVAEAAAVTDAEGADDIVAPAVDDSADKLAEPFVDEIAEDLAQDVAEDIVEDIETSAETVIEDVTEDVIEDVSEVVIEDVIEDDGFNVAALDGADDIAGAADTSDATLSHDDEAELQRELDEVSRESAAIRAERQGRNALPEANDAEMSRIMDQADEELSNPEGNRRRNAIAQLKAAVAATEAARQLGDATDGAGAAETAFREDLDQVVRPRRAARPSSGEARSERPRPAPLKLVASQRVDVAPADAPAEPVRPRRVATAEPATPTDASSFAEFADSMGATELPDLLEAAAAYTAYVEGIEDFSRPQIMKKVQLTASESFSREDGLRSFGTLLRQGRISKVRNGRFQVSDQTRFKPEAQAAQG